MRLTRFVFNWIAILTFPLWYAPKWFRFLWERRNTETNRAVFSGRKWIGEL